MRGFEFSLWLTSERGKCKQAIRGVGTHAMVIAVALHTPSFLHYELKGVNFSKRRSCKNCDYLWTATDVMANIGIIR